MIRVDSNTLALLGMLGVDVARARVAGEGTVELPSEAFEKTSIRANDLELAARGIDGAGDKRVGADAVALYAAFASSCAKFGVGEQTDHVRDALGEILAQLGNNSIPAPGPAVGRLVALRRSISALLEQEKHKPEMVALARAAYAAVSESFGQVAARASEMALVGTTLGDRFPDSWERELQRAAKTEAEIRQRAAERGGTPNKLTFVAEVMDKITALGGEVDRLDGGEFRVRIKAPPMPEADASALSKLVEAIGLELSRISSLIPLLDEHVPSERPKFWDVVFDDLHDRVFGRAFFYAHHAPDPFRGELLSLELQLANLQKDAFHRFGTTLLETAEAEANVASRLWMRARDRFWPVGETRAEMLNALTDELLAKITLGGVGEPGEFALALSAFARQAGLSKEQSDALSLFAEQLGAITQKVRQPLHALAGQDLTQLAAHFDEPQRDSGFYASGAGRRAIEAVREMQRALAALDQSAFNPASTAGQVLPK